MRRPQARQDGQLPDLMRLRIGVESDGVRADFVSWGAIAARPWRNYPHLHSFHEVCYATHGSGRFRVDGSEHEVQQGELFVARPGQVHDIVSSRSDPLGLLFWGCTLTAIAGGSTALQRLAAQDVPAVVPAGPQVPALLQLLDAEASRPDPATPTVARSLAVALLHAWARVALDEPSSGRLAAPLDADEALAEVMARYLRDNVRRPVTVRDVAAQVHLSERHTARVFRRVTGTTIGAFLTTTRMQLAERALLQSDRLVGEIAHSVGYPDPRHFASAFRRHAGMTASEFRRRGGTRLLG